MDRQRYHIPREIMSFKIKTYDHDKYRSCQFGYSPYGFGKVDDSAYEEKVQQVIDLKDQGLSHTQIAKELNLNRSHVDIINHKYIKNARSSKDQ